MVTQHTTGKPQLSEVGLNIPNESQLYPGSRGTKRTRSRVSRTSHNAEQKKPIQKKNQSFFSQIQAEALKLSSHSNNQRRGRTAGMATPLVALHVTAHREGLSTTSVGATERLLARVGVGVDAQR